MDSKESVVISHKGEIEYRKDPMEFILKKGLAVKVGNGLFVLKEPLSDIMDMVERRDLEIAEKVGAENIKVPFILSKENTKKSKYLESFNNLAVKLDEGIACPTVCYHYFASLNNKTIKDNQTITALAGCTRKEGTNSLARLFNFTMREIVFYGTEEYCVSQNEIVLKETLKFMNELDLSYDVMTASDPFFGKNKELKKQAQLISASKYELRTHLPFNKGSLSVASFNHHGKVFYDRFNIRPGNKKLNYSSCFGMGFERLLFTILAQKGVNFEDDYYRKLLKNKGDKK